MKKIIFGCTLILTSVIWVCMLILAGFIVCNGDGKQIWSFSQYGFAEVINELTIFSIIIPIIALVIGVCLVYFSFVDESKFEEQKPDKTKFNSTHEQTSQKSLSTWKCSKRGTINKTGTSDCDHCGARYSSRQNEE